MRTLEPPRRATPTPGAGSRRRRGDLLVAATGAAMGLVLFWVTHRSLADDAYITASYARNLAMHGEWALTPGIPANSATSPLNVGLLAVITVVTRNSIAAIALLLALTSAATAVWLRAIASTPVAVVGTAVLLCSPLLASTVGLESYLVLALLVGLVRHTLVAPRWVLGALLAAALVTARPDMAVAVVVVVALAALRHRRWVAPLGTLVLAALLGLIWPVVSWWRFGAAVSDTLPAKSVAGGWDGWTMVDGLGHYLGRWWISASLTLALLAVGAIALVIVLLRVIRGRATSVDHAAVALGLAGVADYGALSALNVAPFFWYYSPLVGGLGLTAVLACRAHDRVAAPARTRAGWAIGVAAALVVAMVAVVAPGGYAVVRGVPWHGLAPIRINWATPAEYEAIADAIPTGATVESPGEVGVLAYYCADRCRVVDYLADPGRMAPYVARFRLLHPSGLWDLVYAGYAPPPPVPVSAAIKYADRAPPGVTWWPVTFPGSPTKAMWFEPR